jgi:hypothetical protein
LPTILQIHHLSNGMLTMISSACADCLIVCQ